MDVEPIHIAAFVKDLRGQFSPPTVKKHLTVLRMLFDWLVTGHIIDVNPAHAVGGPKYVVKRGKTPVLASDEARALLDSIDAGTLKGLRDRAVIGVMVYTFARVGAVVNMKVKVKDYHSQGRRGCVRLHEKGGKLHKVPCHHTLTNYTDEYIAAAGIAGEPETPRLPHDPAPGADSWPRHPRRLPYVPGDRHHRLPEEQRAARACPDDRQPFLAAYDEALRPAER